MAYTRTGALFSFGSIGAQATIVANNGCVMGVTAGFVPSTYLFRLHSLSLGPNPSKLADSNETLIPYQIGTFYLGAANLTVGSPAQIVSTDSGDTRGMASIASRRIELGNSVVVLKEGVYNTRVGMDIEFSSPPELQIVEAASSTDRVWAGIKFLASADGTIGFNMIVEWP